VSVAPAQAPASVVATEPADVRLAQVTKRFDDVVAVDAVSLEIARGRFFALLGPSGCGKTTTLRMIGGFEEPTIGRIELAGRDVTGLPPYRRDVNTVFQSYALFPHLTIFENVAFGLRRQKVQRRELARRVEEMLELVELGGLGARKPRQLSGGQQQRVALARALVCKPQVLLLDEPLGALDLKLRKQMQLFLKRLQHDVGITFLHVTHDQEEAMTMADAIAVMNDGRIEQLGAPRQLYERPHTAFVAGFLGVSNLLGGVVTEEGVVRLDGAGEVRVTEPLPSPGSRVSIGVRPEKLRVGAVGANTLTGMVFERAYIGVSTQYLLETPAGRITVYVQNVEAADAGAEPGRSLTVSWDPGSAFVLDHAVRDPGAPHGHSAVDHTEEQLG
jgi:spermidine/putrescine transport system ATP-binding protein